MSMEDKYLRHKVLPVDDAARKRVRDMINAYAAASEGHPFGQYGDHITLKKYELCPIYVLHLHTQFDSRPVNDKQYPYTGGSIYTRRFYSKGDVDVWGYNLLTTDRFIHNGKSFEVPGSHHVENCVRCSGEGRIDCPSCDGRGTWKCTYCNGKGTVRKSEQVWKKVGKEYWYEGYTRKERDRYDYVTEYYDAACPKCNDGRVICQNCDGRQRVPCTTCNGNGKIVHCYSIDQELEDVLATKFFYIDTIGGIKEIFDSKLNYKGEKLFSIRDKAIQKGAFTEESEIAESLDAYIAKHASEVNSNCHILFQEADVIRVDAWWVEYTYKGKTYNGCISSALGKERFFAGVSPITEYSAKLLKDADKNVGGTGTVKARELLEKAEKLNVYDDKGRVNRLRELVTTHLNTLYNLGNDLMFWLIALFGTPFLYNYYSDLNPVMRYAFFTNDPSWPPYGWVPAMQCILFLLLLWIAKFTIKQDDHSKARHATVFGYVLSGLGRFLLIAIAILVVLMGLNYLGLSVITSWAGYLVCMTILYTIAIVYLLCAAAIQILKWFWKIILKLWHLVF